MIRRLVDLVGVKGDGQPPYALVVCALLWIGMAMDRYLPTVWLLAVETVMVLVVVVVYALRLAGWVRLRWAPRR